jgi:hypothetical protein
MKRLLNAYAIHRDFAVLAGIDVLADVDMRKRLALWTIIGMRWPTIEEYLTTKAAGLAVEATPGLAELFSSRAVRSVLNGDGIGVTLDLESVRVLAGLWTAEHHLPGTTAWS